MKRPTFFEGVAVALTASVTGGILYAVLSPIFGGGCVLRVLIAGIGLGYLFYLVRRSPERVGRVTVLTVWLIAACSLWVMQPPLLLYVTMHVGMIWLIRSLYFYTSVLCALGDFGLNGLSLAAAVWAVAQSGSVFLTVWCFFLVQALFAAIPGDMSRKGPESPARPRHEDRFQCAHRNAEDALGKLYSVR